MSRRRASATCRSGRREGAPRARRRVSGMSAPHFAGHRRRRLPRLAPLRAPARRGPPGDLRRQPGHRQPGQHRRRSRAGRDFRFVLHDISKAARDRRAARQRPPLRLAGQPDRLPRAAHPDAEGGLARHPQHARPGQGQAARVSPRLDLRGLRRPAGPPAARELLGQRQPGGPARRLRRGQALRRGDDHGLPPRCTAWTPASCASSTPTARACGPTTAAWCRPSSSRRCSASR